MRTVHAFVRNNPGRRLRTTAVFALSALLPEYVFPALRFAAYPAALFGTSHIDRPHAHTILSERLPGLLACAACVYAPADTDGGVR